MSAQSTEHIKGNRCEEKVFQMSIFVKHTSENLHKSGSGESGALFLVMV